MKLDLETAIGQLEQQIKSDRFVRAVLSGRRRNMQTEFERIDIKPVQIKEEIKWQIISSDGKKDLTKNVSLDFDFHNLFKSGYANLLVETESESFQLRITKKDEALLSVSKVKLNRDLTHDRQKQRMLAENNPVFKALEMSDMLGRIKPSKMDKYKQVDEFIRLMDQSISSDLATQKDISVVDLGCGHAYLTFAVAEFLQSRYQKVSVLGVDERIDSKEHNEKVASKLGVSANFVAAKIADLSSHPVDIAIALHACDTATDDAIYWAVKNQAKVIMVAPCCMHEMQTQITSAPEPWGLLTKYGLVKERLVDLLTDSLRAQILKILGYRVDIVEFIGGEHTARNILIRAVKGETTAPQLDIDRYQEFLTQWGIKPYLSKLLEKQLEAATRGDIK